MTDSTAPEPPAYDAADRRAWVDRFVHLMYVEHDIDTAFSQFVAEDYIQHNPGLPDGREAAMKMLRPMFADPDFTTDVKRVLVDGDLVAIHLHGRRSPDPGGAVVDLYRIEGDRLVEHWDVIQPIPQTAANDHPMF